ncbi:MAG: glycosyltransferase [Actinobacteria bacterium]|nr:glycosyltransferase [Actinomycetota bacterium]
MTAVVLIAGWLLGWCLCVGVRRFGPSTAPRVTSVSVVVPARNEAVRLPRLLESLARATTDFELIVVDDSSTDGTADLARAAGAIVITADPPDGWTGKAWACHCGAHAASGDVLVFLDADTDPAPWFVGELAARAAAGPILASVQPWHRARRPYEHASAVPNLVAVLGAGTGPHPRSRVWRRPMAFGPAMALRRSVYDAVGGHESVRASVAEDIAFAAHVDSRGVAVESWCGGGIEYRMYPEGPVSLIEGWAKNLSVGATATAPLRTFAVGVWIAAMLNSVVLLGAGLPGVLGYGLVVLQAGVLLRRVGRFGVIDAVCSPVLVAVFVILFVLSAARRLLGRPIAWRGRVVPSRSS